jgi:putative peptidoglycan lipid II flippase
MTSAVVTLVTLAGLGVTVALVVFSGPLFSVLLPGFDDAERGLVIRYFRIMAPAIVLMAINTFHEYVCQYHERFVQVAAIRLSLPVANLAALVILGPMIGEYCLPLGFLAGHAVAFALLSHKAAYKFRPSIRVRQELEGKVFANTALVMSTGIVARTRSIVRNYLGSYLGGGALSALALAAKLTEPLERAAFAGAKMFMFSRTARLFVARNERALGHLYRIGLQVSFLLLAPLLWWIGLNSNEIVGFFFARGEFTPQMTVAVAAIVVALIPSVLFVGVGQLLSNAFYAMGRIRVPMIVMPAGMLVYVAAAAPLSRLLGAPGLAVATTVSSVVVFAALFVCLWRALREPGLGRTALHLLGYATLGGAVMTTVTAMLLELDAPAAFVMAASLPTGVTAYVALLALTRDETYLRLRRFARDWLVARRAAL